MRMSSTFDDTVSRQRLSTCLKCLQVLPLMQLHAEAVHVCFAVLIAYLHGTAV